MSDKNETQVSEKEPRLLQKIEKTRVRQKSYTLDLKIRTPASLGYIGIEGLDPAPALVRLAETKGIDVIAITDLYSGSFIDRIVDAAKDTALEVIPGCELRCTVGNCNDVTITCLFPQTFNSHQVNDFLQGLGIPPEARQKPSYLATAPFENILARVEELGGVVLPSRLDKTPHRLEAIPALVEKYGFRAFDLAYGDSVKFFKSRWPKLKFHLFSFSNANALAQVGSRCAKIKLPTPGFLGLREVVARDLRA
jgi:hypothetical protein